MRNLLKLLSRVLTRTAKTAQLQRQARVLLSKHSKQPQCAWRLFENNAIKNSVSKKASHTKIRFFVPKESLQTTEKVGRSLENFKRYLESKGFRLTFDVVKLALVGLALNNGNSDILFETITNTYETKEDGKIGSSILYSRRLESDFELISTEKPVENEPYEEYVINNENEKLEENGVMVAFEKVNDEEIADDNLNKILMQLLMLHLQENNNNLRLIEKSQEDFEALLQSKIGAEESSSQHLMLAVSHQDALKEENEKLHKQLDEKETQILELKKQIELLKKSEETSGNDDETYKLEDEDDEEEDEDVVQTFRKPR